MLCATLQNLLRNGIRNLIKSSGLAVHIPHILIHLIIHVIYQNKSSPQRTLHGLDLTLTNQDMDTVPGLGVHGASMVWYSSFRLPKQHIAWRIYVDLHMSKLFCNLSLIYYFKFFL